ncbi:hypothetical protein [Kitasatospora cineracea]|uniref:hypothetical protein n=1 Tax=Kitasatospora cineracea TaxID=88074 RepID=UPI0037F5E978
MTDRQDAGLHADGDGRIQWLENGVNVGHTVYGGIHFHPTAAATGPAPEPPDGPTEPLPPAAPAVPVPALRVAGLLLELRRLSRVCDRAAEALSAAVPAPLGEENR